MKLIITRPIEDSKKMSSYFESRGFECIINPLLEISYQKRNRDFGSYNSVILTSRHAVRSLIDKDKIFAKKTVYAAVRQLTRKLKFLHQITNTFFMKLLVILLINVNPRFTLSQVKPCTCEAGMFQLM